MMKYKIYLNSERKDSLNGNQYEYYKGKTYRMDYETFPVYCDETEAKIYPSKKRAIRSAESLKDKCAYVEQYEICEVVK